MAKKLIFEDDAKDRKIFKNIFETYHITARPASREDHRINTRILDELEKIGEIQDTAIPGFPADETSPRAMVLLPGRQYCVFEDHQMEFLTKALGSVMTAACRSREIEAMWAFIDAAPTGGFKALMAEEENSGE